MNENKMVGFVEYQCSVGQGAGLHSKVFCFISCSCLPTRKISMPCIVVGSALKNVVQPGLVFDVVLIYLPFILRTRCSINKEILQKFKI